MAHQILENTKISVGFSPRSPRVAYSAGASGVAIGAIIAAIVAIHVVAALFGHVVLR